MIIFPPGRMWMLNRWMMTTMMTMWTMMVMMIMVMIMWTMWTMMIMIIMVVMMIMLHRDGSKWSHIASAVENCKVQKNLSNNQVLIGNINWTLVKILFLLCIVCDTSHCNAMGHRHLLALSHESFSLQYMKMCFLQYEDWFLLRQMSKNVDSETFGDFLKSLNQEEDLDLGNNNNKP